MRNPPTIMDRVLAATDKRTYRTAHEIAAKTGLTHKQVGRRLSELCKERDVLEATKKKCRVTGFNRAAYRRRS